MDQKSPENDSGAILGNFLSIFIEIISMIYHSCVRILNKLFNKMRYHLLNHTLKTELRVRKKFSIIDKSLCFVTLKFYSISSYEPDSKNHSLNSSMAWYLKYVIPFIFSITFNFSATSAKGLSYQYQVCSTNKFTPNSTFQSHLTTLFSSLTSEASSNVEFFNNTITGTNSSDTVYGLFMCRGDIPSDLCNHCVGNATQRLSTHADCTLSKAAVVYYDECIVRYSNRSFFSTLTMQAGYVLWNPTNMTNQESFKSLLYDTMNKTADEAADFPTGAKKFGTRETSIDIFQNLYCLAQCTQDLSPGDCRSCLDSLINSDLPECCAGSQGGRVYYPNCIIRFEIYPFFRSLSTAPTPSPAGLVPPANSGGELCLILYASIICRLNSDLIFHYSRKRFYYYYYYYYYYIYLLISTLNRKCYCIRMT